jgi:hypothetical protein
MPFSSGLKTSPSVFATLYAAIPVQQLRAPDQPRGPWHRAPDCYAWSRVPRRPRLTLALPAAALALVALALVIVLEIARPVQGASEASPHTRAEYLQAAKAARAQARLWWAPQRRWYRERLGNRPLATLWGVVHLFEATNALAIAHPSPGRRAAVRSFARGAERYWNPDLKPVGGYGPYPDRRGANARAWFDDNGWWGVAFYDAYRATGDTRYLASAKRALRFIDTSGWDPRNGGIWWDTAHSFHAGESLAGGTLLAASLYKETRSPKYLAIAKKYIDWADRDFRGEDGLYDRHERDPTPMPYVQGPMASAFVLICATNGDQAYCREGEELAQRAADRFPTLTMGPQYDAMYIRSLLELYRLDHNPRWYQIAADTADRAMANARSGDGPYLLTWDGQPMSTVETKPDMLQTHAATTSVLAWLAAADPPPAP